MSFTLLVVCIASGAANIIDGLGLFQLPDVMTKISCSGVNRFEFITNLFGSKLSAPHLKLIFGSMLLLCGFFFHLRLAEKYFAFALLHFWMLHCWITIQMDDDAVEGFVYAFLASIKLVIHLYCDEEKKKTR